MKWSIAGWIAAVILVVGGGAYGWFWFSSGSGEPSTELTTPTIAGAETTTTVAGGSTTSTVSSPTSTEDAGQVAFVIDSAQSTASFEVGEELRDSTQTVVGTTDQVAGQVRLDTSDLSTAQISEILINARTFETGSGQRDRVIRGPVILDSASDEFEFITFAAASFEGLRGEARVGDRLEFAITGDLTIKGVTNEETFDVTAMLVDESMIQGTATTSVSREAYGIGIPSVPGVVNVADEVQLNLDFVLTAS